MSDHADGAVPGSSPTSTSTGSYPEHTRARRGSSIVPPAQWMGHEYAPRTAFITGASSGLGLALVKAFGEAGFKVIASCRNPDESEELTKYLNDNGLPPAVPMCVKTVGSIEKAYKITRELTTSIDVFVNNAGVLNFNNSPYDPVMEIRVDEMVRVYEVNVVGCLKVTQTFMPLVQSSWRHPIIINISSPLGSLELNHDGILAPYRCSKAALNMLTKTFALEMPSVIFLSVSPRNWNHIPSGSTVHGTAPSVEVKQDLRYVSARSVSTEGICTDSFMEDATKIVDLAKHAKKDDSGSFLFTDGEKVPF